MLCFDRFHSTDVVDGKVVFRLISVVDKQECEFSVTTQTAGLMASAIQAASTRLSENTGPSLTPIGFQPVIGADLEPGLMIEFGGNLSIAISMPPAQFAALKNSIQQLEAHSKTGPSKH